MKPVIFIRPQPGCDASVAAARELGLDAHGFPLFNVSPKGWDAPDPEAFDALLIGSANALRHGGDALQAYRGMPAYAVGATTAQACREAGLKVVATGEGGLQAVLEQLEPGHKRLLRLTGAARVELDPPTGATIDERIVYSSDPVPPPDGLIELLEQPTVVMLHSGEAARQFRALCSDREIDTSLISLATIGPRVAEAAGNSWQATRVAPHPTDEALLALARQMCEDQSGSHQKEHISRQGLMQDQTGFQAMATARPPRRSGTGQIGAVILAFALGAAIVAWSAWRGYLDQFFTDSALSSQQESQDTAETPLANDAPEPAADKDSQLAAVSTVEARMAMLEDRLSRLDLQANAASGNAARAESLLIAFAARRMIDRGEPLRYLADQLQLRFANAQPRAVRAIVDFAKSPVTVDELSARLDALGPTLAGGSDDESFWDSAMRDLSNLFTVRREPSSLMSPQARLERARVMLTAGRIREAIAQVQRLPGAEAGATWINDAQRYANVQQALDLLETAAMLEPTRLQDSEGNRVEQPSPLANPASTPDVKKPR